MSDKRTKRKARKRQEKTGSSYQGAWRHVNGDQQRPPTLPPNSPPGVPDGVQENARRYAQAYRRLIRRVPLESQGRRNCTLHLDPYQTAGHQRLPTPGNVLHPFRLVEFHDRRNDPLVAWVPGSDGDRPPMPRGPDRRYGRSWHMSTALVQGEPEEAAYKDFLSAFEEELKRGTFDRQPSVVLASEVAWAIGMGEIRRSSPWKRGELGPFPIEELRSWMIRLDAEEYFRQEVTIEGIGVRNSHHDGRFLSQSIDPRVQGEEIRRRADSAIARGERPRPQHRSTGATPPLDRLEACLKVLDDAGIREVGPVMNLEPLMPFFLPGPVQTSGWEPVLNELLLRSLEEYRRVAREVLGGLADEFRIASGARVRLLYEVADVDSNRYPWLHLEYGIFSGDSDDRVERAVQGRRGSFFEEGLFLRDGQVTEGDREAGGVAMLDLRGYPDEVPNFQENVQRSKCEDLALLRRLVYYWLSHDRSLSGDQWKQGLRTVALG